MLDVTIYTKPNTSLAIMESLARKAKRGWSLKNVRLGSNCSSEWNTIHLECSDSELSRLEEFLDSVVSDEFQVSVN